MYFLCFIQEIWFTHEMWKFFCPAIEFISQTKKKCCHTASITASSPLSYWPWPHTISYFNPEDLANFSVTYHWELILINDFDPFLMKSRLSCSPWLQIEQFYIVNCCSNWGVVFLSSASNKVEHFKTPKMI